MLIRVRTKYEFLGPSKAAAGYPIRSTSFITSLGVHGLLILFLGTVSTERRPPPRPIFEELIRPRIHDIRYYKLPKIPKEVSPAKQVGNYPRPRGAEASKQAVIATSPNPKSTKQMVWLPDPKIQMPQDLTLPNLIARLNTSLPALPAPPKPPPKEPPKPAVEAAKTAPESPNEAAKVPKQAKAFVPPPPSPREPRLPVPTPVLEAPLPPEAASMQSRLPAGAGLPALSAGSMPALTAPPAPVANPGNATVDIAIASLRPSEEAKDRLPSGDRPGQFSRAPETGPPASGPVSTSAPTVPNLTIREDLPKPPKAPEPAISRAILYAERVRSVPTSTLSVPLRPASRTIPRAVDARFQGRNVYTLVVPIENLPEYSGDWILWFADTQAKAGETPVIRAPVPFRKLAPIDQVPSGERTGYRVQIAAILGKDGKLSDVSQVTKSVSVTAEMEKAAIQDLISWEFKPATRNGTPVDVEIVIEIPFSLPIKLAQRPQP